jgi:hypothetical protein
MESLKEADRQRIYEHITEHLGEIISEVVVTGEPHPTECYVLIVVPHKLKSRYVLVTCGMSAPPQPTLAGEEQSYAELVLQLPRTWPIAPNELSNPHNSWPFHFLGILSQVPHLSGAPINFGNTFGGEDWPEFPGSPGIRGGFFWIPSALGENLKLETPNGELYFHGVVPLYLEEVLLAMELRTELFVDRFLVPNELNEFVNVGRPSVLPGFDSPFKG